jgi:hypothetical protein
MVTLASPARSAAEQTNAPTAYLVMDTESIPDGQLLRQTKYQGENLTDEEAIERAQAEARESSFTGSDFLPVTFQIPVSICVARVASDFTLKKITCLDAPRFRTREMVQLFWSGIERESKALPLVTFNGRGFDLPLLELAAFRYGIPAKRYFHGSRDRFRGTSHDLQEMLSNYGACRMNGGLNLLAKMLGLPGKIDVAGHQVYQMHREGRLRDINDYCMFDTLDTYFIFLRTRVLKGEFDSDREQELIGLAKEFLADRAAELPALKIYLDNWSRS